MSTFSTLRQPASNFPFEHLSVNIFLVYDIDSELLTVDFDSNTSEMKANPTKDDYKKQKKLLTEYLKSLKA